VGTQEAFEVPCVLLEDEERRGPKHVGSFMPECFADCRDAEIPFLLATIASAAERNSFFSRADIIIVVQVVC
jgi:hypothetical protein